LKTASRGVLISIIILLISSCGTNNTKPSSKEQHAQRLEVAPFIVRNQPNKKFPLTVNAPQGSRIRIMNIVPKYTAGILLEKGKYSIQVTKPGYQTFRKWIDVDDEKSLTVTLEKNASSLTTVEGKESSPSLVASGDFIWKKPSLSKNDPYYYMVRNFNGHLWSNIRPDDGYGKSGTRSWASAKKYCDNLSTDIKGVILDDFEMPDKNSLKTLWRYRHYSTFYSKNLNNSGVWANVTTLWKDGRHMAKMFYLKDGTYSDWFDSGVKRQSHPTVSNPICVSKAIVDLSHLGLIDFKKTKYMSVKEIADNILTSKLNYLSKLPPINRSEKKPYEKPSINKPKIPNKNAEYINALSMAFYIKHGQPVIKNVNYDTDRQVMNIHLTSSKSNYKKSIEMPVKSKHAKEYIKILKSRGFSPEVEIKVVKNQLIFDKITQIKEPSF